MSDEYYDEDGFRLTFEDDTSEQEKQFFMRAFPNVNKISERKVHCTSCYMHIGTAPISEAVIRMHPILRVTHCRNCHTFYNSGEFDKGEDGSELYCRWCGQGGEVYCCSKCPYVFCKKCIVQNLSRACVQDISRNDNWQCFSCAPKIMWHLRAQHWALANYIEKQKKDMKDKNHTVQAINSLMKQDNTTCCNNKGLNKKPTTPASAKKTLKRASDAHEAGAAKIPEKRALVQPQQPISTPPAIKKQKTDNNEVVCTPDIMSMFMNPEEPPPLVTARTAAASKAAPPPAAASTPAQPPVTAPPSRQVVVRPAFQNATNPVPMRLPMNNAPNAAPPPVYHTINGYKIDLHTAAQQGTYRLPNGKLIQVRKQAPSAPPPAMQTRNVTIAPKPPNPYFNPAVMQNPGGRVVNGNPSSHINIALQQQQQLQEQRLQQQRLHQQQQQHQQQMMQQQRPPVMVQVGQPQPTIVAGQPNPALQLPTLVMLQNMVNGPHEDSPLGRSRKNFEGKLLSGVEICQHIVSKINTLTNSNTFKNIRNVRDVKELYIHVSYLLTYAIGRFKTLHEKCVDDVKSMGFTKESDFVMMGEQISNRNPEEDKSDDEDDCEIVEENTTLITIDSEDEDDSGGKKKNDPQGDTSQNTSETEAAVAAILNEKDDNINSGGAISMADFLQVNLNESEKSNQQKDETERTVENNTSTVVISDSAESISKEATVPESGKDETDGKSKDDDDMVEIIETSVEDKLDDESTAQSKDKPEQEVAVAVNDKAEEVNSVAVVEIKETDEKKLVDDKSASSDKLEEVEDAESTEVKDTNEETEQEKLTSEASSEIVAMETESNQAVKNDDGTEKSNSEKEEVDGVQENIAGKDCEQEKEAEIEKIVSSDDVEMNRIEPSVDNSENQQGESNATENEEIAEVENVTIEKTKNSDLKDPLAPIELTDDEDDNECTFVEPDQNTNEKNPLEDKPQEPLDDNQFIPVTETPIVTTGDEISKITASKVHVDESISNSSPVVEQTTEINSPASLDPLDEQPVEDSSSENQPIKADDSGDDVAAVAETVLEDGTGAESIDSIKSNESVCEKLSHQETADNIIVDSEEQAAETVVGETGTTKITEDLEAPTGNDLLASIEDSFQKLQQLFDSTENTIEESDDKQLPTEVDHEMSEPQQDLSEDTPVELMEVDGSLGITMDKILSENIEDLPLENVLAATDVATFESLQSTDKTSLQLNDGLKTINCPENMNGQLDMLDGADDSESIKSPEELTVNGDC
ncbi:uncharacterized protein LOC131435113 [Malaya genurostris]|uniref:uncharacterized protein LOC131435113 n=1 Tax=Malaya genurostris TaxID=325434 RepID=UPI0026F4065D|nr:uncharacterized protein LOC131435113 [Malaya genurostris]